MKRCLLLLALLAFTIPSYANESTWVDNNCFDGRFVRGDTNGDGVIDMTDGLNVLSYYSSGWNSNFCEFLSFDANDEHVAVVERFP